MLSRKASSLSGYEAIGKTQIPSGLMSNGSNNQLSSQRQIVKNTARSRASQMRSSVEEDEDGLQQLADSVMLVKKLQYGNPEGQLSMQKLSEKEQSLIKNYIEEVEKLSQKSELVGESVRTKKDKNEKDVLISGL